MDKTTILYNVVQYVVFGIFTYKYMRLEKKEIKPILIIILITMLLSLSLNYLSVPVMIKIVAVAPIQACMIYRFMYCTWKKAIITTILFYGLCIISEIMTIGIMYMCNIFINIDLVDTTPVIQYEMGVLIQCVFITVFCYCSCILLSTVADTTISNKIKIILTSITILVLKVSLLVTLYYSHDSIFTNYSLVIMSASFLVSIILYFNSILIIDSTVGVEKNKIEHHFLNTQKLQTAEYYQLAQKFYMEARKIKHDFKNQIECLQGLLYKDVEQAKLYLEEMSIQTKDQVPIFDTGNAVVDTIFSLKDSKANSKGINIDFNILQLDGIIVSNIDISNLLNNILDNAIEAVEKVSIENKNIKFTMKNKNGYLVIKSSNCFQGNVIKSNDVILSSKRKYKSPGYGIRIIKDIVKKYDGECRVKVNNNEFEIVVLLKVLLKVN